MADPEPEVTVRDAKDFSPAALTTLDCRTLLGIITDDEFARAVGVVAATVALWRTKGYGPPFYRFRRNIFYRTADVVQWMIENTVDPATGDYVVPRLPASPSGHSAAAQPRYTPPAGGAATRELRGDGTLELTGDDVDPTAKSKHQQVELYGADEDLEPSAG